MNLQCAFQKIVKAAIDFQILAINYNVLKKQVFYM